jgi:hypothetical protein
MTCEGRGIDWQGGSLIQSEVEYLSARRVVLSA